MKIIVKYYLEIITPLVINCTFCNNSFALCTFCANKDVEVVDFFITVLLFKIEEVRFALSDETDSFVTLLITFFTLGILKLK